jgi:nitrogen fixation NifU-like protein
MSSPIHDAHQEIIRRHMRAAPRRGVLAAADVSVAASNPVCGDEIVLQLRMDGGRIAEAGFSGQGCAVSQASASMMTERLAGLSLDEAASLARRFTDLLRGEPSAAADPALGDLRALAGVSRLPARVRCALLAWNALEDARRSLGPTP